MHVTTAMRTEDTTVFLRLSASFRQDPRRTFRQMQLLWRRLHPLAFEVAHPWCDDADAVVAQHFHELQRDSLRCAPFGADYAKLGRWLCGAIEVASEQATTLDGSPRLLPVAMRQARAARKASGISVDADVRRHKWWPPNVHLLEPWVRRILGRWATYVCVGGCARDVASRALSGVCLLYTSPSPRDRG